MNINYISKLSSNHPIIILCDKPEDAQKILSLSKKEITYLKTKKGSCQLMKEGVSIFVEVVEKKDQAHLTSEAWRKQAAKTINALNSDKAVEAELISTSKGKDSLLNYLEGTLLANYQFAKYFTDKKRAHTLNTISIVGKMDAAQEEVIRVANSTCVSRDLVNEPVSYLNAPQLSEEIKKIGKNSGFKVEVLDKKKIEALKMGGLLAVNQGSIDPPTFNILEWKPKNAKNKKPIILVGKGVVYDTGGLDIKTGGSMKTMKCDMAGAAAVVGTIDAIASNKLPVHVIGLIPATDNRPGKNAYAAGDVIKMHNGKTVEVLNTDAEGRMILADALSYAQKYKPELVIDLATLTGAAVRAIGTHGVVAMGTADEKTVAKLKTSGNETYERIAEMPFWDEYGEQLKSTVADITNLGGPTAGAITAGKFLQHFTDYPWIHLDIAGPSFLDKAEAYRTVGGTGVGVRLLYHFIKTNYTK